MTSPYYKKINKINIIFFCFSKCRIKIRFLFPKDLMISVNATHRIATQVSLTVLFYIAIIFNCFCKVLKLIFFSRTLLKQFIKLASHVLSNQNIKRKGGCCFSFSHASLDYPQVRIFACQSTITSKVHNWDQGQNFYAQHKNRLY